MKEARDIIIPSCLESAMLYWSCRDGRDVVSKWWREN